MGERPIAKKYREGKMKRTLERELTVLEIVNRETIEINHACLGISERMGVVGDAMVADCPRHDFLAFIVLCTFWAWRVKISFRGCRRLLRR